MERYGIDIYFSTYRSTSGLKNLNEFNQTVDNPEQKYIKQPCLKNVTKLNQND